MEALTHFPSAVHFGVFDLNLKAGELRRNGVRVRLQEQPFQILVMLLEHPGDVVTQQEIIRRLWPDGTVVEYEHSIKTAVKKLRQALGDDADTPRYVETIPRRGYRFIAPLADVRPAMIAPSTVDSETSAAHKVTHPPDDHLPVAAVRAPHLQRRWPLWAGGALAMLLVGLAAAWFVRQRAGPKLELTEQRLTFNPSDNQVWSAAISPNGKYLAYSDLTGVSLRLIETGQTRKLFAIKEGAGIDRVAWFPDSTRLLASGNTDPEDTGNIWVTSILGEAPRSLRADASFAVVSPDGAQIAFVSGENLNAIWVMGARGEEQRRIAVYGDSNIATPVWSPDGRRIAYIRMGEDTTTIESRDLNGEPAVPVVSDPRLRAGKGGLWGAALCWSPDGRIIYPMSSSQKSGQTDLWAVRVDPRTGKASGKLDRITSWGGSFFIGLDVTADGKRLAALRAHAQPGVWVGDIRENPTRLEAPRRLTVEDSDDRPSSWTPDSKAVLFFSDRDGRFHIFRQAINQTRAEAVTAGPEDDRWPVVTPDGSWILYEMAPSSEALPRQSLRLMRVPVSGGAPQFVADLPPDNEVRCARLPSTLCVLAEPGPKQMFFYALDPVKGRGRELARTEATPEISEMDLSPDGSRIALSIWETERGRIRILDLSGRTARDLELQGQHGLSYLAWSADGKGLFVRSFGHPDSSERRLLYVGLDGAVRLLHRTIATGGPALLRPSPDGRYLAWAENMWDSNAWMLENF